MFCILLANLRKQVKIPYNLLGVNEHFEYKCNTKFSPPALNVYKKRDFKACEAT